METSTGSECKTASSSCPSKCVWLVSSCFDKNDIHEETKEECEADSTNMWIGYTCKTKSAVICKDFTDQTVCKLDGTGAHCQWDATTKCSDSPAPQVQEKIVFKFTKLITILFEKFFVRIQLYSLTIFESIIPWFQFLDFRLEHNGRRVRFYQQRHLSTFNTQLQNILNSIQLINSKTHTVHHNILNLKKFNSQLQNISNSIYYIPTNRHND